MSKDGIVTVNVDVHIDTNLIQQELEDVFDETTMVAMHNLLAEKCDPYVPYLEGVLSESGLANVDKDGVHYITPYAVKQYFDTSLHHPENGGHPNASARWDEAMLRVEGDVFWEEIQEIIEKRLKELYG